MKALILTATLFFVAVSVMAQQPYPSSPPPHYNPWDSVLKGQMSAEMLLEAYRRGQSGSNPFSAPTYSMCRTSYLVNPATGQMMICTVCYYESGPPTTNCI